MMSAMAAQKQQQPLAQRRRPAQQRRLAPPQSAVNACPGYGPGAALAHKGCSWLCSAALRAAAAAGARRRCSSQCAPSRATPAVNDTELTVPSTLLWRALTVVLECFSKALFKHCQSKLAPRRCNSTLARRRLPPGHSDCLG